MEERKKIDADFADIKTNVAVVQADLNSFKEIINKMDITIDKLSEIAEEVRRVVLLHENRLTQNEAETASNKLAVLTEQTDRRKETNELDARITKLENTKIFALGLAAGIGAFISFAFNSIKTFFIGG